MTIYYVIRNKYCNCISCISKFNLFSKNTLYTVAILPLECSHSDTDSTQKRCHNFFFDS